MLNKSHPLSRYKAISGKNKKKKCLIHFDPDARVFVLSKLTEDTTSDNKIQLVTNFPR